MKLVLGFIVACCTLVAGEGEDGPKDRYLSLPKLDKCNTRFRESEYKSRNFFFSGNDPELKDKRLDWLDSRNTCRERCMETVTFDSQEKFDFFKGYIEKHNISFFWTSGRLCDFDGCEGRWDLLPKRIKGWLWSANQVQLADTNKIPPDWSYQPWSPTGTRKRPQPDNAEFYLSQTPESCIGILNNMYNDSIAFHDIACYHKTRFICEDSELLLKEVLEIKEEEEEPEDGIEESTTKKRIVEVVESTSRRIQARVTTERVKAEPTTSRIEVETTNKIEAEITTRKIEPENTSRRTKTVETTESKIVNAKKTNQSGEEKEPKKPQRRRKIVRKKLQSGNNENEKPANAPEKEETMENANSTLTVENENRKENETLNSTDDAKGDEKLIEEVETTTVEEPKSTTSITRSLFRNRGRRGRSRF